MASTVLPRFRRLALVLLVAPALYAAASTAAGVPARSGVPAEPAASADTSCALLAPGLQRLSADSIRAPANLLTSAPARPGRGAATDGGAGGGRVHAVVEIPAGAADKWEVAGNGRHLVVERVGGEPRRIDYLPYPANYGFVPRTRSAPEAGGDGDPLDVVLLGPALPCGTVAEARLVGALRLVDDGENDTKLLAVRPQSPLGDVRDVDDLRRRYPGVLEILETWFVRYEGPGNRSLGVWSAAEARAAVDRAARAHERSGGAE